MFEETGELWLVYVPHFTVFYQCYEKPESKCLRAVEQDLCHDEIHALNVLDLAFVIRESYENATQFFMAPTTN